MIKFTRNGALNTGTITTSKKNNIAVLRHKTALFETDLHYMGMKIYNYLQEGIKKEIDGSNLKIKSNIFLEIILYYLRFSTYLRSSDGKFVSKLYRHLYLLCHITCEEAWSSFYYTQKFVDTWNFLDLQLLQAESDEDSEVFPKVLLVLFSLHTIIFILSCLLSSLACYTRGHQRRDARVIMSLSTMYSEHIMFWLQPTCFTKDPSDQHQHRFRF